MGVNKTDMSLDSRYLIRGTIILGTEYIQKIMDSIDGLTVFKYFNCKQRLNYKSPAEALEKGFEEAYAYVELNGKKGGKSIAPCFMRIIGGENYSLFIKNICHDVTDYGPTITQEAKGRIEELIKEINKVGGIIKSKINYDVLV